MNNVKLKDVVFLSDGTILKSGIWANLLTDLPYNEMVSEEINMGFISLYGNRTVSPLISTALSMDSNSYERDGKIFLEKNAINMISKFIEGHNYELVTLQKLLTQETQTKIATTALENAESPINVTTTITENGKDSNTSTDNSNGKNSKYAFDSTEAVPDTENTNSNTTDGNSTHEMTHTEKRSGNDGHETTGFMRSYVSYVISNPYISRFMKIVAREMTLDLYDDEMED